MESFHIAAVAFGVAVLLLHLWRESKSRGRSLDDLHNLTELRGTAVQLRLVPGRLTPMTAGVACFLVTTLFVAAAFFVLQYAEVHQLSVEVVILASMVIGAAAGCFDYQFTANGNAEGRWDLIVDRERDFLQLPAVGAWGKTHALKISDVIEFTIAPLVPESDDHAPILHLTALANDGQSVCAHKVAFSRSETELAALRDWITSVAGITDQSTDVVSFELAGAVE